MAPIGEHFNLHVLVLIMLSRKDFKENANIFSDIFNFCVNECKFPNLLKQANITAPFRKCEAPSKTVVTA